MHCFAYLLYAIRFRGMSLQSIAFPRRLFSLLFLCNSELRSSIAVHTSASPFLSFAFRFDSWPFLSFAPLFCSWLFLRAATPRLSVAPQFTSVLILCRSLLIFASLFLCESAPRVPMQFRHISLLCLASPWLFLSMPIPSCALLHSTFPMHISSRLCSSIAPRGHAPPCLG